MSKEEKIETIRFRLSELQPLIDKQIAAQSGPEPMTTEMLEAEKLKIELLELQSRTEYTGQR
jgi:hypothetical protein